MKIRTDNRPTHSSDTWIFKTDRAKTTNGHYGSRMILLELFDDIVVAVRSDTLFQSFIHSFQIVTDNGALQHVLFRK